MKLYQINYEVDMGTDNGRDEMLIAFDGYLSNDEATKYALEQANEVWGDEDEPFTADDLLECYALEISKVGTSDGKRQFEIVLKEITE